MEIFCCPGCNRSVPTNRMTRRNGGPQRICTRCAKPLIESDGAINFVSTTRTAGWIEGIGVVEFDLLVGQCLRYLCPPLPLSATQETELAFLCFPDANIVTDGDSVHHFVFAFNEDECDPTHSSVKREAHAAAREETAKRPHHTPNAKELFCSALFRQKRDPTASRGAQQKALVVLSRYAFPEVFVDLLRLLCHNLFDKDNVDIEATLVAVHEQVAAWPKPVPNAVFSSLPFASGALSVVTPHYSVDTFFGPWSLPFASTELSVHRLTCRQRFVDVLRECPLSHKDVAASCRLLLRGEAAFLPLIQSSGWVVDKVAFDPPLSADAALQLSAELRRFHGESSPVGRIDDLFPRSGNEAKTAAVSELPDSLAAILGAFPQHDALLSVPLAEILNEDLRELQSELFDVFRFQQRDSGRVRLATERERRALFSGVDVHRALFPHITKCWKFWELMITGAPIAVYARDAPLVSAAVMSLTSLTAPISYVGFVRPYLTINNREIDHAVTPFPNSSTIIGMTNPFFVKQSEKWPHFLAIADPCSDPQTHKMLPADSEKRVKQQYKMKNRMFCSRHYVVKTDKNFGELFSRVPPETLAYVVSSSDSLAKSASLRECVAELTTEFLAPLKAYVAKVLAEEQPFFLPEVEFQTLFDTRKFLEYVQQSSPLVFEKFKTEKEAMAIYDAFVVGPSFCYWLQEEISMHYRLFILNVESLEDIVLLDPNPATRHKVLSILQWDFEHQLRRNAVDIALVQKLSALCSVIPHVRRQLMSQ